MPLEMDLSCCECDRAHTSQVVQSAPKSDFPRFNQITPPRDMRKDHLKSHKCNDIAICPLAPPL